MAFDLRAVLRLDDKFSKPLSRIEKATERAKKVTDQYRDSNGRLRDSMGRFVKESDRATKSLSGFTGNVGGALRGLGGLQTAFLGIASAIGGAAAAHKIFEATIGEAAKYEQSAIIIETMFRDKGKSAKYLSEMNDLAINSPLLNSQDIFANSKSFISFTDDIPTLERMFKVAERLISTSPEQGVEGAVFAMKELFSGDHISIMKRFEMGTKKEWKNIRDMDSVKEQVEGLEKLLDKYRITEDVIKAMGDSTLGVWNQIKEATAVALRDIGQPALLKVKAFLGIVNDTVKSDRLDGFKAWAANALESITNGAIEGVKSVVAWVQSIQNDPEFQKETTLFGKVHFVISDIFKQFQDWLKNGGKEKIEKIAADLVQILIAGIQASMEQITPIALDIGTAVANGVISGFKSTIGESWLAQLLDNPVGFVLKKITKGKLDLEGIQREALGKNGGRSSASGLDRVPYNGYKVSAHKDEMVLTRAEAKEYRANRSGGSKGVVITGNTFNVRKDSDIKAIALELANLIEREGGQMA